MRTCILFFFAGLTANGCIPYAVGTTAEPAPVGTVVPSTVAQVAVGQPKINADPGDPDERTTSFSFDSEARFGLDERSDAGVRLAGSSGIVATYKRQLTPSGPRRIATAVMVGGGLLGLGSHAHFEATFVGSWPYSPPMTPYGGLRVPHALATGADVPTPKPASRACVRGTRAAGHKRGRATADDQGGVDGIDPACSERGCPLRFRGRWPR